MSHPHPPEHTPQPQPSPHTPPGSHQQYAASAPSSGGHGPTAARSAPSGRRRWTDIAAVGLLSAVLASGGTYALVAGTDDEPAVTESTATAQQVADETSGAPASFVPSEDWGGVAEAVSPSVVAIEVAGQGGGGAGSGVIWDDQAHVVTNAHVVAGAEQVRVTLADGRTYQAEVSGSDVSTDLAVLTIADAPDDLEPIEIGDDQGLAVGDPVMAIGNPLGLSGTVTTGIVSALDRPVSTTATEGGQPTAVVTNAIQTSAAINPGNSGGALVDGAGRLIGINSAIASLSAPGTGAQSGNIGIGFAIPMRTATSIVDQLIETGAAEHAFLGVSLDDSEAQLDGAILAGAGVVQVEDGSPAAGVGLVAGDVIVDIDGERVSSAQALVAQVRERTAGEAATVGVLRDGERQELQVTLDTRPDDL
jgi:putative serine protease PepD